MTELKERLKTALIEDLRLEGVAPGDIADDAPLFGDNGGLGLDSLDAVEVVVVLQKRFGVIVKDMAEAKAAFASIDSLATYIGTGKK